MRKRGLIIVGILIVATSVAGAYFFCVLNQHQILAIYAQNIYVGDKNISVQGERISVDGRGFNSSEKSFNTKRYMPYVNFYILTKTQPLFASEELDADEFDNSVSKLDLYYQRVKEITKMREDESFMPVNSLHQVKNVHEAQRQYLEEPTTENGWKLISAYRQASRYYRSDTKALLKTFESYYPDGKKQRLNPFLAETTTDIIKSDLRLSLKNADALDLEINKRSLLLRGLPLNMPVTRPDVSKNYKKYPSPILLKNSELDIEEQYWDQLRGPYVVKTACFNNQNPATYFYVYDRTFYGKKVFMPKQADENYYFGPSPKEVQSDVLKSEYKPTFEGNTYRCNDLSYQIKLLRLDEFQAKFGKSLLSEGDDYIKVMEENSTKLGRLRDLEKAYYADKYKSDENLEALGQYYLEAYLELSDDKIDAGPLREELLERYLFIQNRISGVEKIFATSFFLEYLSHTYLDSNASNEGGKYLVTRSAYPVTLMQFTPLFWRTSGKPQYLSGAVENKIVQKYTDISKFLTKEQLSSINKIKSNYQEEASH